MPRDLLRSLRRLARHRVFALTAVGVLAIGIGATTAIFGALKATVLQGLPYPRSEDIYTLNTRLVDGRWSSGRVGTAYSAAIEESAPSVTHVVLYRTEGDVVLTDQGDRLPAMVGFVSRGFFDLFGLAMSTGRSFTPQDHEATAAVISSRLWASAFGRDSSAVGKELRLLSGSVPIVGVAPPEFDAPRGTDVWITIPPMSPNGVAHSFEGYLRVRPSTTPRRLESELNAVMSNLTERFPDAATGRAFLVRPLVTVVVGDLGPVLLIVFSSAGVLLLLASLTVATLLLGRNVMQAREMAIRSAMGAGSWALFRGLLLDSSVLSACGTMVGLFCAWLGLRALDSVLAAQFPQFGSLGLDYGVLLFALAALLVTTLVTAVLPAIQTLSPNARGLLGGTGALGRMGRRGGNLLHWLVIAQAALSIVLVSSAGWLVRSYDNVSRARPGFEPRGRLVLSPVLDGTRWSAVGPARMGPDGPIVGGDALPAGRPADWLEEVTGRLEAFPEVRAVGAARTVPLDRDWDRGAYYIAVPGEPYDPERQQTAAVRTVSPTFFEAAGTRILSGRTFQSGDGAAVIVNEAFVRRYLPDRDPIGESFYWGFPVVRFGEPLPIIGVVEDIRYRSLTEPAEPTFYNWGVSSRMSVVVETTLDDAAHFVPQLRAAVEDLDPSVPFSVTPLTDMVAPHMARHRIGLVLMSLFGLVSLLLGAIGIFGGVAQLARGRAPELATRMALGASPAAVLRLVLRQGRDIALAGAIVGLALTYLGGRTATARLYEVRVLDAGALGVAVGAVLFIAVLSFAANGAIAARHDPMELLRAE